jgi:hypothetical protein
MPETSFKRCFISAPFGTDTTTLRTALEARAIVWRDPTHFSIQDTWLDALDNEVSRADFVCVVLQSEKSGNVLFELGVAFGKHKPVLAFVSSASGLTNEMVGLMYVRSDVTDAAAVDSALDVFLHHASLRPQKRRSVGTLRAKRVPGGEGHVSPISGADAEEQTAFLLQRAGLIFFEAPRTADRGADFAIWADELDSSLGNPLLVQVKAGRISASQLRAAAEQLREYVEKTHGRFGLLIYWDRAGREFPRVSPTWPVIFQLSGTVLANLVTRGELAEELLRLKNTAIHGQV